MLPRLAPSESVGSRMVRYSLKPIIILLTPFLKLFSVLSDNIIWRVLGRTYIYNVSWEDPRVDQRVFGLSEEDHVITLASAGQCKYNMIQFRALSLMRRTWEEHGKNGHELRAQPSWHTTRYPSCHAISLPTHIYLHLYLW